MSEPQKTVLSVTIFESLNYLTSYKPTAEHRESLKRVVEIELTPEQAEAIRLKKSEVTDQQGNRLGDQFYCETILNVRIHVADELLYDGDRDA